MSSPSEMQWHELKGYSINESLKYFGLSFDGLSFVANVNEDAGRQVRQKIANDLLSDLRGECLEASEADIKSFLTGVYCISLSDGFAIDYQKRPSPVLYIGSGNVYSRLKSHVRGKLFEFAIDLQNLPLDFWCLDLTDFPQPEHFQRVVEQSLLNRFAANFDGAFPLLNKNHAVKNLAEIDLAAGWDEPLRRGSRSTRWLLKPKDFSAWKGALQ